MEETGLFIATVAMAIQNLLTFELMQPRIVLSYSLRAVGYSYVKRPSFLRILTVWDRYVSTHY